MDPKPDRAWQGMPRSRASLPVRAWTQVGSRRLGARNDYRVWCRWATHVSIAGLVVVAALGGRLVVSRRPAQAGRLPTTLSPTIAGTVPWVREASARGGAGGYLVRAAVPVTAQGEKAASGSPESQAAEQSAGQGATTPAARHIQTYSVQPGDTVIALAQRFGVSPETILSANPSLAGNPDLLQLGQELLILPVSGVLHVVQRGETLSGIAQAYKVGVDAIIGYQDNGLVEPYMLQAGQKLVVPGAAWTPPAPAYASSGSAAAAGVKATGRFGWPTTGHITQGWWARHPGIDIGTPTGTPIIASDAGVVVEAGWSSVGYGRYVMLDHGNGFRTRYAHMSVIIAKLGQKVEKGQRIGLVGSTGNSTGPHLHFEIYKWGVPQNPFAYLPGR